MEVLQDVFFTEKFYRAKKNPPDKAYLLCAPAEIISKYLFIRTYKKPGKKYYE